MTTRVCLSADEEETVMLKWLGRLFGKPDKPTLPDTKYDPVYGLSRQSVEDWLARNPRLRDEYEAELRRRKIAP